MLDKYQSTVAKCYDEVAKQYDENFTGKLDLAENLTIFKIIREIVKPGESVIDFGCGTGLFLDYFKISEDLYFGVDISKGMLDRAREKHPQYLFEKSDMCYPLMTGFNVAVCLFGSFSYCADINKFFDNMYSSVVPGGKAIAMAITSRYMREKGDILEQSSGNKFPTTMSMEELKFIFPFKLIDAFGFSLFPNIHPKLIKFIPLPLLTWYLRWEAYNVGRSYPDLFYFNVLIGEKHA